MPPGLAPPLPSPEHSYHQLRGCAAPRSKRPPSPSPHVTGSITAPGNGPAHDGPVRRLGGQQQQRDGGHRGRRAMTRATPACRVRARRNAEAPTSSRRARARAMLAALPPPLGGDPRRRPGPQDGGGVPGRGEAVRDRGRTRAEICRGLVGGGGDDGGSQLAGVQAVGVRSGQGVEQVPVVGGGNGGGVVHRGQRPTQQVRPRAVKRSWTSSL